MRTWLLILLLAGTVHSRDVRQRILLAQAPVASVMEGLQEHFPSVRFTVHPLGNGFSVYGPQCDVLAIQKAVDDLNRPKVQREFVAVHWGDLQEVKALLATLVPDVRFEMVAGGLWVEGPPGGIDFVKELLDDGTMVKQVMLELLVVEGSENLTLERPGFPLQAGVTARPFEGGTARRQELIARGDLRVLSRSRVASQSDKDCLLALEDVLALVSFDPVAGQFQLHYDRMGTRLSLKPSVKADGFVTVELRTDVRMLVELISCQYSRVACRGGTYHLRLKDGDTFLLNGLITAEDVEAVQALPLDLPTVRFIYSHKPGYRLAVLLTVHVMK